MLQRCLSSMDAEEKIVIVNDGTGLGKAVNLGTQLATGDYFVISNNDCTLGSNSSLKSMCVPGTVTYANGVQFGSFYCMPKDVWFELGGYDERYEVSYFDDDDLKLRIELAKIPLKGIDITVDHPGGTTLNDMPNMTRIFARNKAYFEKKWARVLAS